MFNLSVIENGTTKSIEVEKNESLMSVLKKMNIYLPFPCGGNGTCGKCKCKIISGFLEISKADMNHFSNLELEGGFRLICTAKLTEDLVIELINSDESKIEAITYYLPEVNTINNIKIEKIDILEDEKSIAEKIRLLCPHLNSPVSIDILNEYSKVIQCEKQSIYITSFEDKIVRINDDILDFYGIGIDIGTTTIAFGIVNLLTGEVLGNLTLINKQREYGADVISRIVRANEGNLDRMCSLIKLQLVDGIKQITSSKGIDLNKVLNVAIAGNTTMLHLLLGLSCRTLGTFPFTPVSLDMMNFKFKDIFDLNLNCNVTILPGISTYVGADISSGILFSKVYDTDENSLLLDIGTNGEMALWAKNKLTCTSTAAGPAFEGGNMEWGTGSIPGAISSVKFEDEEIKISTISNKPAIGICGSGIIDAIAMCIDTKFISKTGLFKKEYRQEGLKLAKTIDGQDIVLTQKDIRELQMGKSAIRSGIDCLLNSLELKYEDIHNLYIAGGFGFKINFENAVKIGLIPLELKDKIIRVGNSSLGGTIKYLLDINCKNELKKIVENSYVYELAKDKEFQKNFIDNMSF